MSASECFVVTLTKCFSAHLARTVLTGFRYGLAAHRAAALTARLYVYMNVTASEAKSGYYSYYDKGY